MPQRIYVDLLFLINFSMDYVCLYICTRILKRKAKTFRMILSASAGAMYSVLSLFIELGFFISLIIDISVCILMCFVAFHEKERHVGSTFLCSFLYLGISMMMGGCMTAIFNLLNKADLPLDSIDEDGISTYLFAIIAFIAGFISLKSGEIISRRSSVSEVTLKITHRGKSIKLIGFADSGNFVRDPISGRAVIIAEKEKLREIADIDCLEKFAEGKTKKLPNMKNIRLIPINTASGSSLLTAFYPDVIKAEIIDRKKRTDTISLDAFIAPSEIGNSAEGYDAIIPLEILKH